MNVIAKIYLDEQQAKLVIQMLKKMIEDIQKSGSDELTITMVICRP